MNAGLCAVRRIHDRCAEGTVLVDNGATMYQTAEEADWNYTSKEKWYNPLSLACERGHADVVRTLLSRQNIRLGFKHRKLMINDGGGHGHTPASRAFGNGHVECAELVIGAGGEWNVVSTTPGLEGQTPLFLASQRHPAAVAAMLTLKADPNQATQLGVTPLYMSVLSGATEVAQLLLDAGADPSVKCHDRTPLELARLNGQDGALGANDKPTPALVELLETRGQQGA